MSSGRACAAFAVLLALVTGCGPKRPKAVVSPQVEVPQLPPEQMAAALPLVPPAFPSIKGPSIKLDTPAPPPVKPEVATTQPHRAPRRRATRPATDEAKSTAAPSQTQGQTAQASPAQPAEQTPIGQLSTANDTVNTAGRSAISSSIDETENGLNSIKRSLNSDEQKTATLIRNYISRARDALKVDDLDGASTLSAKAHQLLTELIKP
jgi:type IV secretory pathway VirB10-like protein